MPQPLAGEPAPLAFSLLYTPPEVAHAYAAQEPSIVASTAADMWAIGVIAYEMLTGAPAWPASATREAIIASLLGEAPLPWEAASEATTRKLLRMRGPILECLSRDPEQRPSVEQLAAVMYSIFLSATTGAATRSGRR